MQAVRNNTRPLIGTNATFFPFPGRFVKAAPVSPVDPALAQLPAQDALFMHQLSYNPSQKPALPVQAMTPSSLLAGKITSDVKLADAIFDALLKHGVVDNATRTPVTAKITRELVTQIDVLNVPTVKELVKLLFFWEQETRRLSTLDGQEARVQSLIDQLHSQQPDERSARDLEDDLRKIRAQRVIRPSARE